MLNLAKNILSTPKKVEIIYKKHYQTLRNHTLEIRGSILFRQGKTNALSACVVPKLISHSHNAVHRSKHLSVLYTLK